jgi:hypothetical protein
MEKILEFGRNCAKVVACMLWVNSVNREQRIKIDKMSFQSWGVQLLEFWDFVFSNLDSCNSLHGQGAEVKALSSAISFYNVMFGYYTKKVI